MFLRLNEHIESNRLEVPAMTLTEDSEEAISIILASKLVVRSASTSVKLLLIADESINGADFTCIFMVTDGIDQYQTKAVRSIDHLESPIDDL